MTGSDPSGNMIAIREPLHTLEFFSRIFLVLLTPVAIAVALAFLTLWGGTAAINAAYAGELRPLPYLVFLGSAWLLFGFIRAAEDL